jgi:Pyridoxamine 5'-phosphate oxidase
MLIDGDVRSPEVSPMSINPHTVRPAVAGPALTPDRVWQALEKSSFAVISYVTPNGTPRSSGVLSAAVDHRLYVVVAPDSWKARHIATGDEVAVTVPIRRGGLLTLIAPIPPATVSFHATATVHPAGSVARESVPKKLAKLLPTDASTGSLIELAPTGRFITYGIGVSLLDMATPAKARAHVPVS